jgi:hypothetical protein
MPDFDTTRGGVAALAVMGWLLGIAIMLFWLLIAWRAMRAHERLADAVDRISRRMSSQDADDKNPFA